ncbi:hypothetical protein JQ615_21675 [Bradyrhizobium jicamae]|uniref:Uncharacterized protein n=1 Tax=Bradyrhizobium jicamae TaxID=280332 RepID=A0ABS5FMH3_9BRAD|nr:hypothetical protein [Bradyrhizobium jicamae]MBR0798004.1 hypothetical protein [Bradyrhizobium jicamae]
MERKLWNPKGTTRNPKGTRNLAGPFLRYPWHQAGCSLGALPIGELPMSWIDLMTPCLPIVRLAICGFRS